MERRKDAKADSRKIRKMAENGCTLEEICESMEINYRQIHYSLTTYYTPAVSTKLLKLIKNKHKKNISTNKIKPKAILLDTSVINIHNILDVLRNLEKGDYIFLFPTIIIEELEKMKSKPKFQGHNARTLLDIALESESQIVITPEISTLSGWSNNNADSLIIQTILDYKEKYSTKLYTCDKVLALKAKSFEIDFEYIKLESANHSDKVESTNVNVETKVSMFSTTKEVNIVSVIKLSKQRGFYYIEKQCDFPYHFVEKPNGLLLYPDKGKVFLHEDDFIYTIYEDRVEKSVLNNFNHVNNSILLKRGVLLENISDISTIDISKVIQELN